MKPGNNIKWRSVILEMIDHIKSNKSDLFLWNCRPVARSEIPGGHSVPLTTYIFERHGSKAKMVLHIPPYFFNPTFSLSILIPESLCKRENPRLFMLSAKLDPKIYSVDLHFVLYFIEFWKNMLYFFTFYNKNDCKPLKFFWKPNSFSTT